MSYPQWLSTITGALRNAKYPQIKFHLIAFKWHDAQDEEDAITDIEKEIEGKCALGELACSLNFTVKEVINFEADPIKRVDGHRMIMGRAGVPNDLASDDILPNTDFDQLHAEVNFDLSGQNLDEYIYLMNDAGYTYPMIIEFLETTFGDCYE